MVVGFLHLEKKTLADVAAIAGKFDYYCWDLYAKVGDFYAADPANKALQAEALHAIEAGGNDTARLAEHVARRIVDCHLATMARLGIHYDLLAHESDILRLHFWDRAFELLKEKGAIRLETEGKSAGCWVLPMGEGDDAIDEDKIIVRSNGTVTYTGKDIAYQLWKLGKLDRDFRYRLYRTEPDGHRLWTTTSGEGEAGAPRFGHATAVYNVIDVGQSYPQRVVKAGVAALGYAEAAEGSPPPRLREGRALPRHRAGPRLRGVGGRDRGQGLGAQGPRGQGRRPRRRARREGAGPRWTRATRSATPPATRGDGHRGRHGRAALLHDEVRAHPDHHLRHGGGPRLHRGDGALRPERRRPRPQHLRQARGGGPPGRRPSWPARARSTSAPSSPARRATRPGRSSCSWPAARRWPSRRSAPRTWPSWPSTPSPSPRPSTPTTRSRSTRCSTPRPRTCAPAATLVVDAFVRQMEALLGLLGIPVPERM